MAASIIYDRDGTFYPQLMWNMFKCPEEFILMYFPILVEIHIQLLIGG